jgi:RimJ/RimL family protein N-acetyltransferase
MSATPPFRAPASGQGVELASERLLLRPLAVDDAPALVGLLAGDWEAVKQTGRMPYPVTRAALRNWISLHKSPASHSFLILRRWDRAPLGCIGFGGDRELAELGYVLGRAFWHRGYATESVRAMMAHARAIGLRGLEAYSFVDNPASARVLTKAGFIDGGVVQRDYPERGGLREVRRFERRLAGQQSR